MKTTTYTTGEVAKICNISVRTVQYYDQQKVISPTMIDSNGRRIYTQKDLSKFQLVCLYKELGFPLKDIKLIIDSNQDHSIILNLLTMQQIQLEQEISKKIEQKNKLIALHDEITNYKSLSITNQKELTELLLKKHQHQKITLLTVILTFTFGILSIICLIVSTRFGGFYPYLALALIIILLLILVYFHSAQNAYICPNCCKKFTINLFKDLVTLNNGKKGKYLRCPYCHQRNWTIETFK